MQKKIFVLSVAIISLFLTSLLKPIITGFVILDFLIWFLLLSALRYIIEYGRRGKRIFIFIAVFILICIWIMFNGGLCTTGFPYTFNTNCNSDAGTILPLDIFPFLGDVLFWALVGNSIVCFFHLLWKKFNLKRYVIYKSFYIFILSAWITTLITEGFLFIAGEGQFPFALIFPFILAPFVFIREKPGQNIEKIKEKGNKIFFSKLGYVIAGIFLGFIIMAITYNMSYSAGWFDFTDLPFMLLSYPLISILHFQPNSDFLPIRFVLYGIALLNLALITVIVDIIGLGFIRLFRLFKIKNAKHLA